MIYLVKANQALDHLFNPKTVPVILSVGLSAQKNFTLLIRAFAKVLENRPARLIILGEGHLREELTQLCADLDISKQVEMPAGVDQTFSKFMKNADLFVLSSN